MKKLTVFMAVLAMVAFISVDFADAQGASRERFVRDNDAGGMTGGVKGKFAGPQGGKAGRTGGFVTDDEGNAAGGSVKGFTGPNGAKGHKVKKVKKSEDGSVQSKSKSKIQTEKGTMTRTGQLNKDAEGNVNAQRNTSVDTQKGSYQGSNTLERTDGSVTVTHTGECFDASGNKVECPKVKQ